MTINQHAKIYELSKLDELKPWVLWDQWRALYDELHPQESQAIDPKAGVANPSNRDLSLRLEKFQKSLSDRGAVLNNVEFVSSSGDEGNGVVTCGSVNKGDLLVGIPLDLMITTRNCDRWSASVKPFIAASRVLSTSPDMALAFQLWELKELSSQGKTDKLLNQYLHILPLEFDLPIWYTFDQLLLLRGTALSYMVYKRYLSLVRVYVLVCQDMKADRHYRDRNMSWHSFKWAVSVVLSRANRVPIGPNANFLALTPGFDMFNHSFLEEPNKFYDGATEMFCVASPKQYEPKQAVTMDYGSKLLADFYINMGFIPDKVEFDGLALPLSVTESDGEHLAKQSLLCSWGLPSSITLFLKPKDISECCESTTLFRILKVKTANGEQLECLRRSPSHVSLELIQNTYKWLSCWLRLLKATLKSARERCTSAQKSHPGTRFSSVAKIIALENELCDTLLKQLPTSTFFSGSLN